MAEIRHVLRDHRTNTQHDIDPALLDLLVSLRGRMQSQERFEVISGFRSRRPTTCCARRPAALPATACIRAAGAIDIRLPGRDLRRLRDAALKLKRGGVGYYHDSDFVHVDTGPVRHW